MKTPSSAEFRSNLGRVSIRGARTHNLRSVNVDVPYYRLTSFCGLSGSGKSSLAFDVLYAEGQRRYLECFSPYVRQNLEQMDKPDVDSIEGIPPAIAVAAQAANPNSRLTVGVATETNDYLRLLFAKIGAPYCCGKRIRRFSPETAAKALGQFPEGTRVMIAFAPSLESVCVGWSTFKQNWLERGFFRGVARDETIREDVCGKTVFEVSSGSTFDLRDANSDFERDFGVLQFRYSALQELSEDDEMAALGLRNSFGPSSEKDETDEDLPEEDDEFSEMKTNSRVLMLDPAGDDRSLIRYLEKRDSIGKRPGAPPIYFVVDRISVGKTDMSRAIDSLETAFAEGNGRCWALVEGERLLREDETDEAAAARAIEIDGANWTLVEFSRNLRCESCGSEFPEIEPNLFSFSSPRGACPVCLGQGWWSAFDMDRVFPNKAISIVEGAIAPWNNSTYRSKLREFLNYAEQLGVRTNVPFSKLTNKEIMAILNGSPQLNYKGLNGFLWSLVGQKYKMHIRVFLARWQTQRVCPECKGARLRKEALAVKIDGKDLHDLSAMPISKLIETIGSWKLSPEQKKIAEYPLKQALSRLKYLEEVGLGYLTLERPVKTLSSGENRRVKLTSALGSDLVDTLYVLDEPSNGLHPRDSEKLRDSILGLRDRGNTVVVVDHDETLLEASDKIVELGPGAGQDGGEIVFEGSVEELKRKTDSLTGDYLSGRRLGGGVPKRRPLSKGFVELVGATGNNLKEVNAGFPLGCLCVVTGVSGAGKSSLVQETLYPALCEKLDGDKNAIGAALPYEKILGVDEIDEVAFLDQRPIGRSPRSNPVTYLKIFDDIRNLFAETPDAKAAGFNAGYFSFNVDGGRCTTCKGEGFVQTEMPFTSDVYTRCPICNGKRYQRHVLDVMYRGRNIADALELTAREAFGFFRGHAKIQQKLKRMMDVGLDYLRLGQPANTLSGGESQRLKLASYLSTARKGPTLFIMDEPTAGLHFADVVKLLDGFNALVEAGNSIVVVEHNLLMMKAADYIIDLGPGAADEGGRIVVEGTPEEVAKHPDSITGRYVAKALGLR